jgi:Glycosyltransferase family 20
VHDKITYITLDLSKEDHHEYYNGFTNRVLWPILHYRVDLAEFSRRDLSGYLRVNDHFARELHKVLRPDDFIWVHDYHLMPPRRLETMPSQPETLTMDNASNEIGGGVSVVVVPARTEVALLEWACARGRDAAGEALESSQGLPHRQPAVW